MTVGFFFLYKSRWPTQVINKRRKRKQWIHTGCFIHSRSSNRKFKPKVNCAQSDAIRTSPIDHLLINVYCTFIFCYHILSGVIRNSRKTFHSLHFPAILMNTGQNRLADADKISVEWHQAPRCDISQRPSTFILQLWKIIIA